MSDFKFEVCAQVVSNGNYKILSSAKEKKIPDSVRNQLALEPATRFPGDSVCYNASFPIESKADEDFKGKTRVFISNRIIEAPVTGNQIQDRSFICNLAIRVNEAAANFVMDHPARLGSLFDWMNSLSPEQIVQLCQTSLTEWPKEVKGNNFQVNVTERHEGMLHFLVYYCRRHQGYMLCDFTREEWIETLNLLPAAMRRNISFTINMPAKGRLFAVNMSADMEDNIGWYKESRIDKGFCLTKASCVLPKEYETETGLLLEFANDRVLVDKFIKSYPEYPLMFDKLREYKEKYSVFFTESEEACEKYAALSDYEKKKLFSYISKNSFLATRLPEPVKTEYLSRDAGFEQMKLDSMKHQESQKKHQTQMVPKSTEGEDRYADYDEYMRTNKVHKNAWNGFSSYEMAGDDSSMSFLEKCCARDAQKCHERLRKSIGVIWQIFLLSVLIETSFLFLEEINPVTKTQLVCYFLILLLSFYIGTIVGKTKQDRLT